jgi:DNA-binding transcriptional ArsR family regulator
MDRRNDLTWKALADPTRRGIFEHLARDGAQAVHVLTARAGVAQPTVSKHLRVLKMAQLVVDRREGHEIRYSARPQALAPLVTWIGVYGAFWQERLNSLEAMLKRMDT